MKKDLTKIYAEWRKAGEEAVEGTDLIFLFMETIQEIIK